MLGKKRNKRGCFLQYFLKIFFRYDNKVHLFRNCSSTAANDETLDGETLLRIIKETGIFFTCSMIVYLHALGACIIDQTSRNKPPPR